jgi:hypothetical protein
LYPKEYRVYPRHHPKNERQWSGSFLEDMLLEKRKEEDIETLLIRD